MLRSVFTVPNLDDVSRRLHPTKEDREIISMSLKVSFYDQTEPAIC